MDLPNFAKDFAYLNTLTRNIDETLGIMPISCGDLDLEHDSDTMRARARDMPSALKSSKADAPILCEQSRCTALGILTC